MEISTVINVPNDVLLISKLFNQNNKDLFLVGGSVRDHIQGKTPHDFDLVTNALPEESKEILKDWNVSDEQGKNFGVLRIFTKDEPLGYELAVYRADISKGRDNKGNDTKVNYGQQITIYDDVKRRDLTINSLFYDINKNLIIDLVGGVEDIKNNVIKCVGEPIERFNEDRLRIIRCLRFAARMNGNIDNETSDAIIKDHRLRNISEIDDVSQERIIEEFNKVFEHSLIDIDVMKRYINLITYYDMWNEYFPNIIVDTNISFEILNKSIIYYELFKNNNFNDLKKLKFDNKTINELNFIREYSKCKNVYQLAKLKSKHSFDEKLIIDITKHFNIDVNFTFSFIKYCNAGFIIDGNELAECGFIGKEIEIEKERLENERFVDFFKTNL